MSITREEAIELKAAVGRLMYSDNKDVRDYNALIDFIESALRPVSREQVEKVFSGCDFCKIELDDYPYIIAHSDYSSSDTCYEPSFCPICGKPLTDEAVEMVMERMEALYEQKV